MLELDGVSKFYGARPVLRDVSLALKRGQFGLVTGRSGAGKTTLLRLCCGLERADLGSVKVADREVGRLHRRSLPYLWRNLGLIEQEPRFDEAVSVHANLLLALRISGVGRREAGRQADDVLTQLGAAGLAGIKCAHLSSGQRRWAALARALVGAPMLLLADEPTAGLDPTGAEDLLKRIADLAASSVTVLVASHDPLVVRFAATRGWLSRELPSDAGGSAPRPVAEGPTQPLGLPLPPEER